MTRQVAAALFVGAFVIACGTPGPTPTAKPSLSTPAIVASASATAALPTPTPTVSPPTQTAAISLESSPAVPFAADPLTLTIDAYLDGSTGAQIAGATVDFGDGSSGTTSDTCTARPTIEHAYTAGDYQPKVISATACEGASATDLANATTPIHVLPVASPASASWPTCTTFQLPFTGETEGAAAGSISVRVALKNASAIGCTIEGYPGLQLIAPDGRLLPTSTHQAATGSMTFPAVVPHRVALAPGGFASFDVGYADNPFGAAANEPYSVACPASSWVRIILPGTHEYRTAALSMGACSGALDVSPIVPGPNGFSF
jgi:hypothetical protein